VLRAAAALCADTLQVSCCGLEELLQLLKKWHAAVNKWLGVNWQTLPEVQPLLALPPGKRYSRKHMPEVGSGVYVGKAASTACVLTSMRTMCNALRTTHSPRAQQRSAMRLVPRSAAAFAPCAQGVGCGGGEHPEDALPFIHSARVGQKAREDMQKMLLHCAELPNVQVSGFPCLRT
jgi:hypothetical protein